MQPGPNQHHIPQSLLRGFACSETKRRGKASQKVWVYSRRAPSPALKLIKEVAAEKYFYSDPANPKSTQLDRDIKHLEDQIGLDLRQLRGGEPGEVVEPMMAATLVAHLAVRPAFVRDVTGYSLRLLVSALRERLRQQGSFKALVEPDGRATETLQQSLDAIYARGQSKQVPEALFQQLGTFLVRHRPDLLQNALQKILAVVPHVIDGAVNEGHNSGLISDLAPPARVERLKMLTWSVVRDHAETFILPDCVAIGYEASSGPRPVFMLNASRACLVLMPVSSCIMLVGRLAHQEIRPDVIERHNINAASCSYEFFCGSTNSARMCELSASLGCVPTEMINASVAGALSSVWG